ncbi:hypothetical protein GGI35DRAFT_359096 [Trichoderma velutinum]
MFLPFSFTFSFIFFFFYPAVRYTTAYAATDAVVFFFFFHVFLFYLGYGGAGDTRSMFVETNLFTRERRRNMIYSISCDTGDTAYAVTLRFAFYTLEKDAERLCFPSGVDRRRGTGRPWSGSEQPGWMVFGLRKRALGYLDAMHSSPPVERRDEAVCIKTQQRIVSHY